MRSSRTVAAEIAATEKRVQALQAEYIDARLAERDTIVRLFQQHWNFYAIAAFMGMTKAAVQGVLYREGMTVRGRHLIASKLDDQLRSRLRRHQEQAAESAL